MKGFVNIFDGKRLKQRREEKTLIQTELGKYFNISDTAITHYEKGNHQPDVELIPKLANFFDVSTGYSLGLTDLRTPANRITEAIGQIRSYWSSGKR